MFNIRHTLVRLVWFSMGSGPESRWYAFLAMFFDIAHLTKWKMTPSSGSNADPQLFSRPLPGFDDG